MSASQEALTERSLRPSDMGDRKATWRPVAEFRAMCCGCDTGPCVWILSPSLRVLAARELRCGTRARVTLHVFRQVPCRTRNAAHLHSRLSALTPCPLVASPRPQLPPCLGLLSTLWPLGSGEKTGERDLGTGVSLWQASAQLRGRPCW